MATLIFFILWRRWGGGGVNISGLDALKGVGLLELGQNDWMGLNITGKRYS